MKLSYVVFTLLIGLITNSPVSAFAEGATDPAALAALLKLATSNNPALLAAREQIEVSASRLDQASALPDPQLSFSFLNYPEDNLSTDASPMTGNDIKLSQQFPFPGKLSTKRELAHQQELWARASYADMVLQVRQKVRDNWYKLSYLRHAITLIQTNIRLLDDLVQLTETRYQVGKGLQQNVLKAQVERSRLLDSLLTLKKEAQVAQAQINSLAGQPTDQALGDLPDLTNPSYDQTLDRLQQQAREHRPLFAAYDALISQYEQKVRLAKLDYRPDFNLWASYRLRDDSLPDGGTNFLSGGISINLPFPSAKRRAADREADSGLHMARQQRNDFTRQVDLDLFNNLTELQQAQKLVELYGGGIIPQAEQAYKATLAAYQVDKVDFLALTDSLLTLYRYRIDHVRAKADVLRSIARLQATTGLDDIPPANSTPSTKEDPHA